MKYYDETRMRGCREALEATVLKWPGVAPKDMMGCKVYFRGRKFFAFLVTDGIVLGGKLSGGRPSDPRGAPRRQAFQDGR